MGSSKGLIWRKLKQQIVYDKIEWKLPPPQPRQAKFISSNADITLYGGSAGSGKTLALLLDFAQPKLLLNPGYEAVIFRKTYPEIKNPGGLLSQSQELYTPLGGKLVLNPLEWRFPSGAKIAFRHLQHAKDVYSYQGAQFTRLAFDEATHFTEEEVFYLLSRCRSTCGIKPLVRMTCNPDADSWLAKFIAWYLTEDGYPDQRKSFMFRYFVRHEGKIIWANSQQELLEEYPHLQPKSFTFVPAKITDNPILLEKDPDYVSNLMALHPVERARLLDGNWKIQRSQSLLFDIAAVNECANGCYSPPAKGRVYLAGIDPNFGGNDYFVCQIWDVTTPPFRLVHQYRSAQTTNSMAISQVIQVLQRYRPELVAVEANSGGAIVREQLIQALPYLRIESVVHTVGSKRVNTDRLAMLIESRQLRFPAEWEGIEECKRFGYQDRQALSGHDDCIMAAAVAFAWLTEVIPAKFGDGVVFW